MAGAGCIEVTTDALCAEAHACIAALKCSSRSGNAEYCVGVGFTDSGESTTDEGAISGNGWCALQRSKVYYGNHVCFC